MLFLDPSCTWAVHSLKKKNLCIYNDNFIVMRGMLLLSHLLLRLRTLTTFRIIPISTWFRWQQPSYHTFPSNLVHTFTTTWKIGCTIPSSANIVEEKVIFVSPNFSNAMLLVCVDAQEASGISHYFKIWAPVMKQCYFTINIMIYWYHE